MYGLVRYMGWSKVENGRDIVGIVVYGAALFFFLTQQVVSLGALKHELKKGRSKEKAQTIAHKYWKRFLAALCLPDALLAGWGCVFSTGYVVTTFYRIFAASPQNAKVPTEYSIFNMQKAWQWAWLIGRCFLGLGAGAARWYFGKKNSDRLIDLKSYLTMVSQTSNNLPSTGESSPIVDESTSHLLMGELTQQEAQQIQRELNRIARFKTAGIILLTGYLSFALQAFLLKAYLPADFDIDQDADYFPGVLITFALLQALAALLQRSSSIILYFSPALRAYVKRLERGRRTRSLAASRGPDREREESPTCTTVLLSVCQCRRYRFSERFNVFSVLSNLVSMFIMSFNTILDIGFVLYGLTKPQKPEDLVHGDKSDLAAFWIYCISCLALSGVAVLVRWAFKARIVAESSLKTPVDSSAEGVVAVTTDDGAAAAQGYGSFDLLSTKTCPGSDGGRASVAWSEAIMEL